MYSLAGASGGVGGWIRLIGPGTPGSGFRFPWWSREAVATSTKSTRKQLAAVPAQRTRRKLPHATHRGEARRTCEHGGLQGRIPYSRPCIQVFPPPLSLKHQTARPNWRRLVSRRVSQGDQVFGHSCAPLLLMTAILQGIRSTHKYLKTWV